MMVSTHVLVGGLVGYTAAIVSSSDPTVLILAGCIGGLLPELDFLFGHHRKTLHYPFVYTLGAVVAGTVFLAAGITGALLIGVFLLAAAIHSVMDIFAGAELRSWDQQEWQETAVYDHLRGTWIAPRRWAYGGSRRDLLLSLVCFIVLFAVSPETRITVLVLVLMAASIAYSVTIRPVSDRAIDDTYDTLNGYIRDKIRRILYLPNN